MIWSDLTWLVLTLKERVFSYDSSFSSTSTRRPFSSSTTTTTSCTQCSVWTFHRLSEYIRFHDFVINRIVNGMCVLTHDTIVIRNCPVSGSTLSGLRSSWCSCRTPSSRTRPRPGSTCSTTTRSDSSSLKQWVRYTHSTYIHLFTSTYRLFYCGYPNLYLLIRARTWLWLRKTLTSTMWVRTVSWLSSTRRLWARFMYVWPSRRAFRYSTSSPRSTSFSTMSSKSSYSSAFTR